MGILARLFAPFRRFQPADRVNLVRSGLALKLDGVVVAHTSLGVLVDWPNEGHFWVDASELVLLDPEPLLSAA